MSQPTETTPVLRPRGLRFALLLVAVTAGLSLLYGFQALAGSPLHLPVTRQINDIVMSPDKTLVAGAAADGTIRLWDLNNDWQMRTLTGHSGAVVRIAFAPDSETLVSAGRDGTVRVWNVATGQAEKVLGDNIGPLNDASLSADGATLATVGDDGTVRLWTLADGRERLQLGPVRDGGTVALARDGGTVAAGDGPNIRLWNTRTGQELPMLQGRWKDATQEEWLGHRARVTTLVFSPDGTLLASGAEDASLTLWSVTQGQALSNSSPHWAAVKQVTFAEDGTTLFSACADTRARRWLVSGGKNIGTYEGHSGAVNTVAYAGPQTMISAGDDGTVRVWNLESSQVDHLTWIQPGFLPVWETVLSIWMIVSGLLGLLVLWGMWRGTTWSHLLALALYLLGPLVVLGLPLGEAVGYPLLWGTGWGSAFSPQWLWALVNWLWAYLQVCWPALVLLLWYIFLTIVLARPAVAENFETSFSLPLAQQLMARRRTLSWRSSVYTAAVTIVILVLLYSVLRRFNLDISFMQYWLRFIMEGSGLTLGLSAASIALAVILALLGALGRLSNHPIGTGIAGFYVSLIRGTPLLVQIFIWYLGLSRLGIVLPEWIAGILALGVNYGAYMTEIFRAGIQAIGKGQYEAAQALGMSGTQTFRRIVLPQAFRIVIPPIGNEFIAMMKDSALVSVMGLWELTFRAQKIGRQYARNMETFIIAAAFYWLLTIIFQFLQGKLEAYMARGERR